MGFKYETPLSRLKLHGFLKNQKVNHLFNKGCRKFASQDVNDSLWSISKRPPLFAKKRKFP